MKFVMGVLACLLMSGCSTSAKEVEGTPKDLYKIVAVASTEVDKNGDTCADATGVIQILHNKIVGSANDTFGRSYSISGSIDADNNITGGFAITIVTAVDYVGSIAVDRQKAKGTWEDLYKCSGTWKAQKLSN